MIKVRDRLYKKVHDIIEVPRQMKLLKMKLFEEGYEIIESALVYYQSNSQMEKFNLFQVVREYMNIFFDMNPC